MTHGILIDLSGTLHVGDCPLPGAVAAIRRLQRSGVPFRFVTNTSRKTRAMLHADLVRFGFDVPVGQLFTAPLAVRRYLEEKGLRPHLLVHPDLEAEFDGLCREEPNAVVIGFARHAFTYGAMNRAFRLLMNGAPLLATGRTRYFEGADGLELDTGPFLAALEYGAQVEATVLGKPSPEFFFGAVAELGCAPDGAVMVGDDAVSDVGAAVRAGLRGILVRTGKYRPGDEAKAGIRPEAVASDVAAALEMILKEA